MQKKLRIIITTFFLLCIYTSNGYTQTDDKEGLQEKELSCAKIHESRALTLQCSLEMLGTTIPAIHNPRWRDQSYREYAKILVNQSKVEKAIKLIPLISNPDTKALTIRAIGIRMAKLQLLNNTAKLTYFDALHKHAKAIDHPGSQEVALTYIAIAESTAGLINNAIETAGKLKTQSLRNKSYQEIAEVISAQGKDDDAFLALQLIDDHAFKNKAYSVIANIFVRNGEFKSALKAIEFIDDPYIKTNSLLYIFNTVPRHKTDDKVKAVAQ